MVLAQLIVRDFRASAQPGACLVGGSDEHFRSLVLLQQIVRLGKRSAEVQPCGEDFLFHAPLEHLVVNAVQPPVIRQQSQPVLQFIEEGGYCLRLVYLIDEPLCPVRCFPLHNLLSVMCAHTLFYKCKVTHFH